MKTNAGSAVELVTIRFYTNVVTIFNSFNEQTQSAKLAQSKQLICDTLTPQVLYIFIELYFVSIGCLWCLLS